jgi:hypothetical protein
MNVDRAPFGQDPDGNARIVAVLLEGTHEGLVVWRDLWRYAATHRARP